MWIPFAIIVAIASGIRRVFDKGLTSHFGNFSMSLVINIFSLVTLLPLLFIFPLPHDIVHLSMRFWTPLLVSCLVQYPLQMYLYIRAVREGEISSVVPLMTVTPVFNILTSFVLLGEIPTLYGFLGIVVIIFGVYFLARKKGARMQQKPEMYMLASMFLFALGGTLDKVAIQASTAIFYAVANSLVSLVVLYVFVIIAKEHHHLKKAKTMFWKLLLVGTLLTVSYAGTEIAFSLGPTSYVLAIRSGAFVITALWGLFKLKEEISTSKIMAIGAFIAGSILLAFA